MSNLVSLKRRIVSTTSTKKITSAMKMISVAKLKKSSDSLNHISDYSESIYQMLLNILKGVDINEIDIGELDDKTAGYIHLLRGVDKEDSVNKKLIIAISPDKGLCGSLNANIIKNLNLLISNLKNDGTEFLIIPFGKKVTDYCKQKFPNNLVKDSTNFTMKNGGFDSAKIVVDKMIELFQLTQIDSCHVIYSKFISTIKQESVSTNLIPFNNEFFTKQISSHKPDQLKIADMQNSNSNDFEIDGEKSELLSDVISKALLSIVLSCVKQTEVSEHAARMFAMDNATKNADKAIKSLKLKYNRGRQTAITTQILEIISGVESVS
jgi:F-type H+-transporting ATPase subunit gamma